MVDGELEKARGGQVLLLGDRNAKLGSLQLARKMAWATCNCRQGPGEDDDRDLKRAMLRVI